MSDQATHRGIVGQAEIRALVPLIGQRPAGEVAGARARIAIDVLLDEAVPAERAVEREAQVAGLGGRGDERRDE